MQKTRWDGEGGHENGEMEKNSFVEKKKEEEKFIYRKCKQ